MGAQAGGLLLQLAIQPDRGAEHHREHEAQGDVRKHGGCRNNVHRFNILCLMASARKTTLRTKYKVRSDAAVRITVVFGDGQKGSSSILGPPSRIGELTRWPLGT